MKRLKEFFLSVWRDERGQGIVEYGLILALVAVVVIALLTLLGTRLRDIYQQIVNTLNQPSI